MKINQVRLQKYLSERGIASRRHAAEIIRDKRVMVNHKLATEPSFPVAIEHDIVTLDGNIIPAEEPAKRTIILNKPRGYICSTSSKQGKTIYELIPGIKENLLPVGRLDKNSEGLILMSNDGDLINHLTHPRYEQEKTYHVSASGAIDPNTIKQLNSRMEIDGYLIRSAKVSLLRKQKEQERHLLEFVLMEGRKRQIRHMCERVGLKIHRLQRVKVKTLTLKGLKPGEWRDLTEQQIKALTPA